MSTIPLPEYGMSVLPTVRWMFEHGKDVENRKRWHYKHRGPIALCTSQRMTFAQWCTHKLYVDTVRKRLPGLPPLPPLDALPMGGVIFAVATLADVWSGVCASPWGSGPVYIALKDYTPIEPTPVVGAQGLFRLSGCCGHTRIGLIQQGRCSLCHRDAWLCVGRTLRRRAG